jgi:hypothetical protein
MLCMTIAKELYFIIFLGLLQSCPSTQMSLEASSKNGQDSCTLQCQKFAVREVFVFLFTSTILTNLHLIRGQIQSDSHAPLSNATPAHQETKADCGNTGLRQYQ